MQSKYQRRLPNTMQSRYVASKLGISAQTLSHQGPRALTGGDETLPNPGT